MRKGNCPKINTFTNDKYKVEGFPNLKSYKVDFYSNNNGKYVILDFHKIKYLFLIMKAPRFISNPLSLKMRLENCNKIRFLLYISSEEFC